MLMRSPGWKFVVGGEVRYFDWSMRSDESAAPASSVRLSLQLYELRWITLGLLGSIETEKIRFAITQHQGLSLRE